MLGECLQISTEGKLSAFSPFTIANLPLVLGFQHRQYSQPCTLSLIDLCDDLSYCLFYMRPKEQSGPIRRPKRGQEPEPGLPFNQTASTLVSLYGHAALKGVQKIRGHAVLYRLPCPITKRGRSVSVEELLEWLAGPQHEKFGNKKSAAEFHAAAKSKLEPAGAVESSQQYAGPVEFHFGESTAKHFATRYPDLTYETALTRVAWAALPRVLNKVSSNAQRGKVLAVFFPTFVHMSNVFYARPISWTHVIMTWVSQEEFQVFHPNQDDEFAKTQNLVAQGFTGIDVYFKDNDGETVGYMYGAVLVKNEK